MSDGLAGLAIGALAVCCAAIPLLAGAAGGLAVGVVLGVGAGIVALILLSGAVFALVRGRSSSVQHDEQGSVEPSRSSRPSDDGR